jgi:hypothetical protein
MPGKIRKSSITGHTVTEEYAAANKETTETHKFATHTEKLDFLIKLYDDIVKHNAMVVYYNTNGKHDGMEKPETIEQFARRVIKESKIL